MCGEDSELSWGGFGRSWDSGFRGKGSKLSWDLGLRVDSGFRGEGRLSSKGIRGFVGRILIGRAKASETLYRNFA